MSIKAIIFDFYGVICSEIGTSWYANRVSDDVIPILKREFDHPSNLGKISEEVFFDRIGRAINSSGEAVRKEWTDAVIINQELTTFIHELKQKYKIAVCSNTQPRFFREVLEQNGLTESFDVVVSSSEIGIMKPDPRIFQYTLKQLNVLPEEAFFIDDREENTKAAESLGIRSLVYKNIVILRKELGMVLK